MIDPKKYGVSFSVKQCRDLKINPDKTLSWLINHMGFRRFRLMSYWNELEKNKGEYDFSELDKQVRAIAKGNGSITMCLGVRQPRWPENHWPDWAWQMPKKERDTALLAFTKIVVNHYKKYRHIISWQLENEALLKTFGEKSEVDVTRLKNQYALVSSLDKRPIIMTTSTSWGIPIRNPIPSIVGFSLYNIVYNKGKYRHSLYQPLAFRIRALLIKALHRKPSFIHELQLEPWGPKAIWEMSFTEQGKSMNKNIVVTNIAAAKATGLFPIDFWGGEWWYWRHLQGDNEIFETVQQSLD